VVTILIKSIMMMLLILKEKRSMEVMVRNPSSQFPMWGGAGPRFSDAGPRSVGHQTLGSSTI
jgi:hypothetical protein